MKHIHIKRLLYRIKHDYLNLNTAIIAVALFIAASWAWGAVGVMQKNYELQKELDAKRRDLQLADLQKKTLEFEQRYYQSDEYKELAAREKLGLAAPGERVLILPPAATKDDVTTTRVSATTSANEPSNFQQWINFIFGGNSQRLNS